MEYRSYCVHARAHTTRSQLLEKGLAPNRTFVLPSVVAHPAGEVCIVDIRVPFHLKNIYKIPELELELEVNLTLCSSKIMF